MPVTGRVILCVTLLLDSASGMKPCRDRCLCAESSGLADCRLRGLVRVPAGVPRGTRLLDLSGNELTDVHAGSFVGLWSLRILLMSNSSIRTLQPQSLSSLQFLERLDLSVNRLHRLPRDFSRSLASLQELRLDRNLLRRLDSASLGRLENLRRLDLSHNRIRTVAGGAFVGLSKLSRLSLEGNRLNAVPDGLFRRQGRLEVLLLGHNNISVIGAEALAPLRSLALLGLQGNRLQAVGFKAFQRLRTTSTADLLLASNPWICDCELQRVFEKIRRVRHLRAYDYRDVVCRAPAQRAGRTLASLDGRLCVAETASLLVITVTVALAVIGALVKAGRNRKSKQTVSEPERRDS
ncbi:reticulon-4 receptor [Brachionichthys hirsutus]|uniref:reticulon-4 receptor n=1 Tax=Brachionichthys hirsutus TaxID=412623 RepID=UPI003604C627